MNDYREAATLLDATTTASQLDRMNVTSDHGALPSAPRLGEPPSGTWDPSRASADSSSRRSCLRSSGASASSRQRSTFSCRCGWRFRTQIVSGATPTISAVSFREWPCACKKAALRLVAAPAGQRTLEHADLPGPLARLTSRLPHTAIAPSRARADKAWDPFRYRTISTSRRFRD